MEHPLITGVGDLTVEQLQAKISELNKKLSFAMRTGNAQLVYQLRMAIETFTVSYNSKLQEMYQQQNKNGPDFSDKIDIS
jgi:hypothetical protein